MATSAGGGALFCINGGLCPDNENETSCVCPLGYAGTHCEFFPDDDIDECVDVLQTTGTLSGTELYEAVIRVESDAIINPPAQIDFSAGQEILLKPGFEVKDNAVLHAYILGCSN